MELNDHTRSQLYVEPSHVWAMNHYHVVIGMHPHEGKMECGGWIGMIGLAHHICTYMGSWI